MAHLPVLLKEILENLNPKRNHNFIDATVGDGGHAKEILKLISPNGKLLAVDRDINSIAQARINLFEFGNRVLYINDSFGNISEIMRRNKLNFVNGILFDFGMSSSQLEGSGRGFSFGKDEFLDMRYDIKTPITAQDIVNEYGEKELAEIFKKWGEEPYASRIARAIIQSRRKNHLKTTGELVRVINKTIRRRGKLHPATLTFQALRIEVNQELVEIKKALEALPKILLNGGRAAFISFHSLEDRLVKNWAKNLARQNKIKIINEKPITASGQELKINPRSRSAKLRIVEKINYD